MDAWMFVVMFAGYAFTFHDNPPIVAILFAMLLLYLIADVVFERVAAGSHEFLFARYER